MEAESDLWDRDTARLLSNLVVALNEYSEAVRRHLDPDYFFLEGKFVLFDSLGVTNSGRSIMYSPERYDDGKRRPGSR